MKDNIPALHIMFEETESYGHIHLRLFAWNPHKNEFDTWLPFEHPLRDAEDYRLMLTAQGNNNERSKGFYGFRVQFDRHVDSESIVRLAALCNTLNRKMRAIDTKRGSVQDFGEYVARVCEALKIGVIVRKAPNGISAATGTAYQKFNVGDGVECVRSMIRNWSDKV